MPRPASMHLLRFPLALCGVLLLAGFPGCPTATGSGGASTGGAVPLAATATLTTDEFYVDPPPLMRPGEAVPLAIHDGPGSAAFRVVTQPPGLATLSSTNQLVGGPKPGVGYLTVTDGSGHRTAPVAIAVADRVVLPPSFVGKSAVALSPDGTWAVVTGPGGVYPVDLSSAPAAATAFSTPLSLPACRSGACQMAADGSFCWIFETGCTDPSLPSQFFELIGPPPKSTLSQVPVPASVLKPCDTTACDEIEDLAPDRVHVLFDRTGDVEEMDFAAGTRTPVGPYPYGYYGPSGHTVLLADYGSHQAAIRLSDGTVTALPDLDPGIPPYLAGYRDFPTTFAAVAVAPGRFVVGYRNELVSIHLDATGTVTGVSFQYDGRWGSPAGGELRLVPVLDPSNKPTAYQILDAAGRLRWQGQLP